MTQSTSLCPKCQGEMVQGYVEDRADSQVFTSHWISGLPVKEILSGIKSKSKRIPIGTFRCRSCGFLEFYAREDFAAEW